MRFLRIERPVAWLWIAFILQSGAAQEAAAGRSQQSDAARQLAQLGEAEASKGFTMAYQQAYASRHRQIRLQGSLYAVLSGFRAEDCRVWMEVSITDLYGGTIEQKPIPNTQAIHRSSTELALDLSAIASLRVVQRRPVQLGSDTHPVCDTPTSCNIPWLEIKTTTPVLRIENYTNDIQGYDGFVRQPDGIGSQFYLPFSSAEAANAVAAKLGELGAACGKPFSDQPGRTLLWLSPGQVH